MPQAIQTLPINEQRALRSWFSQQGPFWDDSRHHTSDDYLEFDGSVVTDTAVGEAAWCRLNKIDQDLISIAPSSWEISPIPVKWISRTEVRDIRVPNFWEPTSFESAIRDLPIVMDSWEQLGTVAVAQCPLLTFSDDSFSTLSGHPFVSGAAHRLLAILRILDQFKSCFDTNGSRTPEGHELYQNFFTGVKGEGGRGATFSDSSDTEKAEFGKEMTFAHPNDPTLRLFCTWHGKIQTPPLRVHFTWPVKANEPLYVVYVGQKLTKR